MEPLIATFATCSIIVLTHKSTSYLHINYIIPCTSSSSDRRFPTIPLPGANNKCTLNISIPNLGFWILLLTGSIILLWQRIKWDKYTTPILISVMGTIGFVWLDSSSLISSAESEGYTIYTVMQTTALWLLTTLLMISFWMVASAILHEVFRRRGVELRPRGGRIEGGRGRNVYDVWEVVRGSGVRGGMGMGLRRKERTDRIGVGEKAEKAGGGEVV